jgi:hypothetical protein
MASSAQASLAVFQFGYPSRFNLAMQVWRYFR